MGWFVLLPALVAIALALWSRQVHLSLLAGLWLGATMIVGWNPISGLAELSAQLIAVFQSASNTRVVFFCLLVGGLIALVQRSGGVAGFVAWAQQRGWGASRRSAELLAWGVGVVIFVESNISSLTVGAVGRPFFDNLKLPREKLAYYCDATCAPVCILIPLNGWGAYVLGLLAAQNLNGSAVSLLVHALPFNFFALFALLFALLTALTGWSLGPMRRAEERARNRGELTRPNAQPMVADDVANLEPAPHAPEHVRDLLVPLSVMIGMIFLGLYVTGEGNLMQGSGSTAVLWAVGTAIGAAGVLYAVPRDGQVLLSPAQSTELVLKGASGLVGVTMLIVLAFALGQISRDLDMGAYLAGLVGPTLSGWLPAAVFLVGCALSFALGSSWTTFAILIPIALPLAHQLDLDPALILGATLSGGIFGDHASPLSDTSIISSMSAACDHADHINSQLPYVLVSAALALVAFLIAGLMH